MTILNILLSLLESIHWAKSSPGAKKISPYKPFSGQKLHFFPEKCYNNFTTLGLDFLWCKTKFTRLKTAKFTKVFSVSNSALIQGKRFLQKYIS